MLTILLQNENKKYIAYGINLLKDAPVFIASEAPYTIY